MLTCQITSNAALDNDGINDEDVGHETNLINSQFSHGAASGPSRPRPRRKRSRAEPPPLDKKVFTETGSTWVSQLAKDSKGEFLVRPP